MNDIWCMELAQVDKLSSWNSNKFPHGIRGRIHSLCPSATDEKQDGRLAPAYFWPDYK